MRQRPAHRLVAPRSGELRGVQALRFVAALAVVLAHLPPELEEHLGGRYSTIPTGIPAVAVFFTISGLVAVIVTSRRDVPSASDFLRRRLVRIVPLAWAFTTLKLVTALAAPAALSRGSTDPVHIVLSYLFLPAHGADGRVQPLYTVCWTLSFELAFYLLVALALRLRRDPVSTVAPVLAVLAAASLLRGDDWPAWAFYADPLVLFFVVGTAVGRWWCRGHVAQPVVVVLASWSLWIAVQTASGAPLATVLMLPGATVLLAAVVGLERPVLERTPSWLVTLGDASYALYLSHPVVLPVALTTLALVGAGPGDGAWCGAAVVAACVVVSVLLWKLLDQPLTRLLVRRTARRASPPAPVGPSAPGAAVHQEDSRHH